MLLKLENLIAKYGMKITGVVQVGAHEGQEVDLFIKLGIENGKFFEPCIKPYKELIKKKRPGYFFYKTALGENAGEYRMINKCEFNNGQSNSLLKPKKHLEYYPEITFTDTEEVPVNKLDWYGSMGNLLVMDVQGYELEVLKGATETLKHIDYIYTEVNREELYENCAMVEDLDNYLTDFRRVETKWNRKGFGDALFIRSTLLK